MVDFLGNEITMFFEVSMTLTVDVASRVPQVNHQHQGTALNKMPN